jgi:hypothetical protein
MKKLRIFLFDFAQLIKQVFSALAKIIFILFKALILGIFHKIHKKFFNNLSHEDEKTYLEIGNKLFIDDNSKFNKFFNLYLNDKSMFASKYKKILIEYTNFDIENLKPIEAFYIFADSKNILFQSDWKDEENESEIEVFIQQLIHQKIVWANTTSFRINTIAETQGKGTYIVGLLKSIDKDLQIINHKLLFFELDWDSYIYTAINQEKFDFVINNSTKYFHGIEKI